MTTAPLTIVPFEQFGTYLSQLLWAKAVLLTSPLVATCALSLTIPCAVAADSVTRCPAPPFRSDQFVVAAP